MCVRCGTQWEVVKNKRRKTRPLCQSCRTRRASVINTAAGKCIPWHGDFGSDWVTPIDDDGRPYLPGERTCGHSDCVNTAHIKPTEE